MNIIKIDTNGFMDNVTIKTLHDINHNNDINKLYQWKYNNHVIIIYGSLTNGIKNEHKYHQKVYLI